MSSVKEFTSGFQAESNFDALRKSAFNLLENADFPGRKSEAWKYTRTSKLTKQSFKSYIDAVDVGIESYQIPNLDCYTLVFVNGCFRPELSDSINESGIQVGNLKQFEEDFSEFKSEGNIFNIINQAYFTDGLYLKADKNKTLSKPVHVIHVASGDNTSSQIRHYVRMEQGSEAEIITSYFGDDDNPGFNNTVSKFEIGENAGLKVVNLQLDNINTHSLNGVFVKQARDSRFSINTLTTGGKLVRNDLSIAVEGTNAESTLNGAYVLDGDQHVDNHTVVDHKVSDCESSELYKGVMDDQSTGVFNGKVFVREDAQRINAFQSNANILLSDVASIFTKPELEIYADDVKCSHGSTTGQLDKEAIFYLRARGMSKKAAERLLVNAFVKAVFENIERIELTDWINKAIESKFERK